MDLESKVAAARSRKRRGVGVRVSLAYAQQHPFPSSTAPQYIREPELRINLLGGIGSTTLRRMEEDGFPPAIKLTERIRVWDVAQVMAYLASRPFATTTARPGAGAGADGAPSANSRTAPEPMAVKGAAARSARGGVK